MNSTEIYSINKLNQDTDALVTQAASGRSQFFKDPYARLQLVHFSDIHANKEIWERLVEYINSHPSITLALHTGDYCGNSQQSYVDFYKDCLPCKVPILNCTGNHDFCPSNTERDNAKPDSVHRLLFNHIENWDVNFMDGEYSMTYYKDFTVSNIRLIVLNCYSDIEKQYEWLTARLSEAKELGYHVVTASHESTARISKPLDVTFQTADDYESLGMKMRSELPFDSAIADFKKDGGIHICHLCGHEHTDRFGYTDNGVLNAVVECATSWQGWYDGVRVRGDRSYDCFNVVTFDTNIHTLKLIRIGRNCDHYLRMKRVLCYDYMNCKVICNG